MFNITKKIATKIENMLPSVNMDISDSNSANEDNLGFYVFLEFDNILDCIDAIISHDLEAALLNEMMISSEDEGFTLEFRCEDYYDEFGDIWQNITINDRDVVLYSVLIKPRDGEDSFTPIKVKELQIPAQTPNKMIYEIRDFTENLLFRIKSMGESVEGYW